EAICPDNRARRLNGRARAEIPFGKSDYFPSCGEGSEISFYFSAPARGYSRRNCARLARAFGAARSERCRIAPRAGRAVTVALWTTLLKHRYRVSQSETVTMRRDDFSPDRQSLCGNAGQS